MADVIERAITLATGTRRNRWLVATAKDVDRALRSAAERARRPGVKGVEPLEDYAAGLDKLRLDHAALVADQLGSTAE